MKIVIYWKVSKLIQKDSLEIAKNIAPIITTVLIIFGLWFSYQQLEQNRKINRKQFTYKVMELVQDATFIDTFTRISTISQIVTEQGINCESISIYYPNSSPKLPCLFHVCNDINFISRRLELVIYVYNDDIGERIIISKRIEKDVNLFLNVLRVFDNKIDVKEKIIFFTNFLDQLYY